MASPDESRGIFINQWRANKMIVNGSPIEFTQREILTVSVFLQVRVSEILAISTRIHLISSGEFQLIRMHRPSVFGDYHLHYSGITYTYSSALTDYEKTKLLLMAYLFENDDVSSMAQWLNSYTEYSNAFKSLESELNSHIRTMNQYTQIIANFGGYKRWDMQAFIKAARKQKALVEVINHKLSITFKNVRCGNETEGYLQYKSIQLFLDDGTKKPYRAIYTFNNFFWDSGWGVQQHHLHPHIATGNICFGNRVNDYTLYVNARAYPFIIEVLKESVNNYSPDGPPYSNVTSIRQRVAVLSKLIDVNLTKDKHQSLREVNDVTGYMRTILDTNRCRHCGSLMAERQCTSSSCDANPNSVRNCNRCGVPLTVGEWNTRRSIYERVCSSTNCQDSPNYTNQVEIPYCRICGSLQMGVNHQCANSSCRGSHSIQWRPVSGRYNATTAFPMITPQQAEDLRNTVSVLSGTISLPTSTPDTYYCPHCNEMLTLRNASYRCSNESCRNGHRYSYFHASDGSWIESAPSPRCPECNNNLEYRAGEGFFCVTDDCTGYDTRYHYSNGASVIPF